MRGVLLVALSNLRRRPLLAGLMGLVLAVSALLLSTSLGVVTGIARPVERTFEDLAGSHLLLELDARTADPASMAGWWSRQPGVLAATSYATLRPEGTVLFRGKGLSRLILLSERPVGDLRQDFVRFVEGAPAAAPGAGEVWVPTGMAYAFSPPVAVGEILRLPAGDRSVDLRVSAIVVDPLSSASAVQPFRLWVAPGSLAASFPLTQLAYSWIGVRLADPASLDGLWAEFQRSLPQPFSGLSIDWDDLRDAYLFVQQLIGMVLLVFAAVSTVIILLILSFTVSAAILADYRAIGILKSQGFTSRGVAAAYVLQHLLVASVALPAGAALGVVGVRLVTGSLVRALGLYDAAMPLGLPIAITVALMAGLVAATAALSARRVGRIRPAEAMRFGVPRRETAGRRGALAIRISRLPVSVGLGLRQALTDRRRSAMLLAALGLTVFVFVFAVNTAATFRDIGSFGPVVGMDASDVTIERPSVRFGVSHEALVAELAADPRVAVVVPACIGGLKVVIPAEGEQPAQTMIASVYDGDFDAIGLENLSGRNPRAANEVSLGAVTARRYGREPGDWFDVILEGSRYRLLVTGVYQSTSNFGQGLRLPMTALRSANPAFEPVQYPLKLAPGTDTQAWVAEYRQRYGASLVVRPTSELLLEGAGGITTSMNLVVLTLAAVFAVVAAVIVFNSTVIRIAEQRGQLGVLKSVGMTQAQLAAGQAVAVLALAALAAAVALPLALVLSPRLMAALGSTLGLVRFPFKAEPFGTAASVVGCAAIALAACLAATRRILGISPRVLIQE